MTVQSNIVSTVNIGQGNKVGHAEVTLSDGCGGPDQIVAVTGDFTGDIVESDITANTNNQVAVLETIETQKGRVNLTFCVETLREDGVDILYDQTQPNACASN